jgi:hypothetical protein
MIADVRVEACHARAGDREASLGDCPKRAIDARS